MKLTRVLAVAFAGLSISGLVALVAPASVPYSGLLIGALTGLVIFAMAADR